ncbi:MAG TPA: MFS transporter [Acidobacteriota bacterium]|nr:MFS transporter [Acidobacteriota bacterium]
MATEAPKKPSTLKSLLQALRSWRTASVTLLSFASGLPLGLVWISIPDWLRSNGVDIRIVGLITLAQAPWTFKFLWSPLMDRYVPPWLGRRRGWAAISQIALLTLLLVLAGVGDHPDTPWIIGALALAIAFASATQDVAIDAYTVDVLRPEEQGVAVGARIAMYRAAMYVAGGLTITLAATVSWKLVVTGLALLYLPMLLVTIKAPEPEVKVQPPTTLKEAVWLPFLGFLSRHRAIEILAFVVFYKFADNLATALLRPFLIDVGYNEWHRGVGLTTVGLFTTLGGAFIGGTLTTILGLGHSLWLFGVIQIISNIGYIFVANSDVNVPLMYSAMGFETFTQGLGTGAFSVLLIRMTQKRFSATQYALFSSLFSLPRVVSGPISGVIVDAAGWNAFFWLSMILGIPGLILLSRFVPLGVKEPEFVVEHIEPKPLSRTALIARGVIGTIIGFAFAASLMALLAAIKIMRANKETGFDFNTQLIKVLTPADQGGWITLFGIIVFALVIGLFAAAIGAARSGNFGGED